MTASEHASSSCSLGDAMCDASDPIHSRRKRSNVSSTLPACHPRSQRFAAWRAEPRTTRGGQPHYSALAITTALTLRAVFRLALRQTEGPAAASAGCGANGYDCNGLPDAVRQQARKLTASCAPENKDGAPDG